LGCASPGADSPDPGGGRGGTTGTAGSHAGTTGSHAGTTGTAGAPGGGAGHGPGGSTSTSRDPIATGAAGASGATGSSNSGTAGANVATGTGGSGGTPTPGTGTGGTTGTAGSSAPAPTPTGAAGTGAPAPTPTGAAGTGAPAPTPTGAAGTGAPAPTPTGAAGTGAPAPTPTGAAGAPPGGSTGTAGTGGTSPTTAANTIKNVFVIAMENEPAAAIYGNKNAPYLNGLLSKYAHATAFTDPLADGIPSEPHYVWMEAGTNKFSDVTFTGDSDPSSGNSTKNTAHLSTQMLAANPPISFMGAMEGMNTGTCPVSSTGMYAAKHDPFIFFQDIAGSPPSKTNALCAAHHTAFTTGQAFVQGAVAQYNFISPNLCHDMRGDSGCPSGDPIAMGDAWLASNLPPLIDYANAHNGVIFIVWDEPEGGSSLIPFFAIGPQVKPGYTSTVAFTHSSLVKTVEEIFGLPILPTVAGANDFADLFQPGTLP
jgi:acid phosphatase